MPQAPGSKEKIPRSLIALIAGGSFIVIFGAIGYYLTQKEKVLNRTYNELSIITSLKAQEVQKWRQEHIRDGTIISRFLPVNKLMYSILDDNNNEAVRMEVLQRLQLFIADYDYHSAAIADNTGKVRLTYPPTVPTGLNYLPVANIKSDKIEFTDLHFSDDVDVLHIDMIIPIVRPVSKANSGFIILKIDPEVSLFPNLRVLPTPSLPAEILLVRRDGDSVAFLNYDTGIRGKLMKRSMNNRDMPAVRAVEGFEGGFEGFDYMDGTVLSYLRRIPDSQWALVAKVDKDEALYFHNKQAILISIIALLIILIFNFTILYLWRKQNIRFYRELSATKDRFISIITHDLTNPIMSISGLIEILTSDLKKENYDKASKFAEVIQESSLSAMNLIRNLAQWSRIQTDQIRFDPKTVNFTNLISESVDLLKAYADRKNVKIHRHSLAELEICADKEMISTVLRNLLANAIKYSRPGGEIYISAEKTNKEVSVVVVDHGTGINQNILSKILSGDGNISTPGTMAETGTGLGLGLCKEFVERHGGRISVESKQGMGSKFSFIIPDNLCEKLNKS